MRKYVRCDHCGKRIYEGEISIRDKTHPAFYCSYRCCALEQKFAKEVAVTDEVLKEDNLVWDSSLDFEQEKTWDDIYREFLKVTDIDKNLVQDYRPCGPPYCNVAFSDTIIVWVKNKGIFLYNPKMIVDVETPKGEYHE